MNEMIRKEKPDAVCLLPPADSIASLAANILERGIPLLLEKPPGRTREEILQLIDIANKKGVPHRVAFNRRYAPLVIRLGELLSAERAPGQVRSIQYDMYRVDRRDEDFSTTAIHAIDAARFIACSDYKRVNFTYRNYPDSGINVADIYMACEMKSGAIININICPVTGIIREAAAVNCRDKTYFLDFLGNPLNPMGRLIAVEKNDITANISGGDTDGGAEPFVREGFYNENKAFFDDIIAGRTPAGSLDTAYQSVVLAECVRERALERAF
jgi:predicted dehydrogenase